MKNTNTQLTTKPGNDNLQMHDSTKHNERHHRCRWCNELHPKSELQLEADFGLLCNHCVMALRSRGETLTILK